MDNQGARQQSVRDVTGTTLDYNGDWHALFDLGGIPQGDFNGRLLAWINDYLGTSYAGLPQAMQAFAVDQGYINWSSMGTFDAAGEYAPINTVAPVVSGTPTVGQQLTTTDGTWDADPAVTGYTYQWYRAPSTAITGATNDTYTLVAADFEADIFCRVTATNDAGSTPADSNEVGPVAGFILDDLATTATAAWSMARRLTATYEGPLIRLRRVSDSVESDFGPDANGDLDIAAITTWIGGSSATVKTVYDQISSSDMAQATTGNQPTYSEDGCGGRPGFDVSSGDLLSVTAAALDDLWATDGMCVHTVYKPTGTQTEGLYFLQKSASGLFQNWYIAQVGSIKRSVGRCATGALNTWGPSADTVADTTYCDDINSPLAYNSAQTWRSNGSSLANSVTGAVGAGIASEAGTALAWPARSTGQQPGVYGEVVLFASQLSSGDLQTLNDETTAYYGA